MKVEIKKTPLFVGIEEHDIEKMLQCLQATSKKFKKGAFILVEESPIADVGIVLSGSVSIIKEDYWGNRVILAKVQAGELFGETFSCAELQKLPVSVVADESVEVLFINYKRIITTCSSTCAFHTKLIENMVQVLAEKNIIFMQKMDVITKKTTREKLLAYLSAEAKKTGKNQFRIPFNRQELADYLAVDRSAMSKELGRLRDEGILEFKKNYFQLM